jgi:hypothetical protein
MAEAESALLVGGDYTGLLGGGGARGARPAAVVEGGGAMAGALAAAFRDDDYFCAPVEAAPCFTVLSKEPKPGVLAQLALDAGTGAGGGG